MDYKNLIENPEDYLILYDQDYQEPDEFTYGVIAEEVKSVELVCYQKILTVTGKTINLPWMVVIEEIEETEVIEIKGVFGYIIKKPWRA